MTPPNNDDDDDDAAQGGSYAMLIAGIVIAVLGIWLMHVVYNALQLERCQEEGRRDCAPIQIPADPSSG